MTTGRPRSLVTAAVIVGLCFGLVAAGFRIMPEVLETVNRQAVDRLFRFRAASERFRLPYTGAVVHVDVNDTSIERLADFYLDRTHYAAAIEVLSRMDVAAQLYDFIFAAPLESEGDRAMVSAARRAGTVYFGLSFRLAEESGRPSRRPKALSDEARDYLEASKWRIQVEGDPRGIPLGTDPIPTLPELAAASRGLGFLNVRFDPDAVFRRTPLLVRYGDAFYPSLPFRAVCDYLGVPPDRIVLRPGEAILLKGARGPGDEQPRDIAIPIDESGNMVINFIGPWGRMRHYHFSDVLDAARDRDEVALWREEFSGRIVLVSEVSTGAADVGPVPTDNNFPLSGLHANVIHTILSGRFLEEISGPAMLLVEAVLLAMVLLLYRFLTPIPFFAGSMLLGGLYLASAAGAFLVSGIILHIVRPLMMIAFSVVALLIHRYVRDAREKAVLRRSFEAYFPPSVVKRIIDRPEAITTGGQKKELTVLFSDIKSFTRYSADMDPDRVQRLLNDYFGVMTDVVFNHQGTVDKFIGDGLMVFFGDPDPQPDHALRCVRAAIEMQEKVREHHDRWRDIGGIDLRVRIGISTGMAVAGNMGSARRLSYTVIGAAVNLAQRLESKAPEGGILISQRTRDLVADQVAVGEVRQIRLKGYEAFVPVYEVEA